MHSCGERYTVHRLSASSKDDNNHGKEESKEEDDKVAGSFFNPVPPQSDDDDNDNNDEDSVMDIDQDSLPLSENTFEAKLSNVIKKRTSPSRASEPSTINGVPTAEFKGFGSPPPKVNDKTIPIQPISTGKKDKSFIGIGKPLNDVTKPEYDDQGYTLYADEKTGKKSRVFEALIEYPTMFTLKIVGANEGLFADEMKAVVADVCKVTPDNVVIQSIRNNGKWTSVTLNAPVQSAEMLYELYEQVDRDPRVKFKF